jgi:hypothetical protein
MNCVAAIDRMLEAGPQDLTGEGDSELASHLAACDRCRTIAEQFVAGQLGLARELEAQTPRLPAGDALRIAERKASAISRRNAAWQIGAPLAAAASLTALVLLNDDNNGAEVFVQARVPEPLPGLEVTAPPGKDVAVFKVTDRPDVVVVWFLDAGDE